MTHRAAILLGSNVEPTPNLEAAVAALKALPTLTVVAVSSFYRTEPVGPPGQQPFTNAAAVVATAMGPEQLRSALRQLEGELGRVRTGDPYAPRTIDLDLLLFDNVARDFGTWTLPDQALLEPHALIPLAEIAPDWVLSGHSDTLAELASRLDPSGVERLSSQRDARVRFDPRSEP